MTDDKESRLKKAHQEELDEIDRCNLCERLKDIMPDLPKTCYATKYCHRQMRIEEMIKDA